MSSIKEINDLVAENARLKVEAVDFQLEAIKAIKERNHWIAEYDRIQAKRNWLEDAIAHALHRRKKHGETLSCSTLEAALAKGETDATSKPTSSDSQTY